MEFVDKLLAETEFLQMLEKLEQLEERREFCRHGLGHLLDTARIAWIRALEEGVSLEKEMLYLTALLHDLGRIQEYEAGIPHHQAGSDVAKKLLAAIGYPKEKQALIVKAIEEHRGRQPLNEEEAEDCRIQQPLREEEAEERRGQHLSGLLHWADKTSRNCFFCRAQRECNWEQGKRNEGILY